MTTSSSEHRRLTALRVVARCWHDRLHPAWPGRGYRMYVVQDRVDDADFTPGDVVVDRPPRPATSAGDVLTVQISAAGSTW